MVRIFSHSGIFLAFLAFLISMIPAIVQAKDQGEWLVVNDEDLSITEGSALDFSAIFDNTIHEDRIGINHDGQLAWNNGKGARQRFLCAPLLYPKPQGLFPDKAQSKKLAKQLRMHGYNMANIRFVDGILMHNKVKDFDFDKVQLDRFHYLLYELKKNGIMWMLDAGTSWNGAYGFSGGHRYSKKYSLDLDVHFDPNAQLHWKKMVISILGSKNPYTDNTIINDSNLALITLFNEGGIGFLTRKGKPKIVSDAFTRWSIKAEQLNDHNKKLNNVKTYPQFLTETEEKTLDWMTSYLRNLKYTGLISAYNNGKKLQSMEVRKSLDVISVHGYFDHPSNFVRPGSKINNISSIQESLPHVQYLSSVRELGKPFIVDEYDQPYWSEWRRELGLLFPAYASFQDWDAICRFSNPVVTQYSLARPKRQKAIFPFGVGMDPVARAGETLSALLYRRGDVAVGRQEIGLEFSRSDVISQKKWKTILPVKASRLSLYVKMGNINPLRTSESQINLIDAITERKIKGESLLSIEQKSKPLSEHVLLLKKIAIPRAKGGVINSTEQIKLFPDMSEAVVITDNTEAVLVNRSNTFVLNNLTLKSSSPKVLLSVSSIDRNDIYFSERLLITFVTNAKNTGDHYSSDGKTLLTHGLLPVQIQDGYVNFQLKNSDIKGFKLFALALNGDRKQEVPFKEINGSLFININLSALETGPTFYFELVKEFDHE